MDIQTLDNWSQALSLVTLIIGVMAVIYIILQLINQKRDKGW